MIFDLIASAGAGGKFIYANGREYAPLTGNIRINIVENYGLAASVENTGEYLKIRERPGFPSNVYGVIAFQYEDAIDVTRLKKIYVELAWNDWGEEYGDSSSNFCRFGVCDDLYVSKNEPYTLPDDPEYNVSTLFVGITGAGIFVRNGCAYATVHKKVSDLETPMVLEIDVSALSGNKYLTFECQSLKGEKCVLIKRIYTE